MKTPRRCGLTRRLLRAGGALNLIFGSLWSGGKPYEPNEPNHERPEEETIAEDASYNRTGTVLKPVKSEREYHAR